MFYMISSIKNMFSNAHKNIFIYFYLICYFIYNIILIIIGGSGPDTDIHMYP